MSHQPRLPSFSRLTLLPALATDPAQAGDLRPSFSRPWLASGDSGDSGDTVVVKRRRPAGPDSGPASGRRAAAPPGWWRLDRWVRRRIRGWRVWRLRWGWLVWEWGRVVRAATPEARSAAAEGSA